MWTVEVIRLGFPQEDGDTIVGEGFDVDISEFVNFVVPPDQRLRVLADAHAGRRSVLTLHPFDVVRWDAVLGVEWDD